MTQRTVIGPIDNNDWNILRELKSTIDYLGSYGMSGFTPVIEKHKERYKEYLKKYL